MNNQLLKLEKVVATYALPRVAICKPVALPVWTTQLCCLCSKTVELSATVNS